MMKNANLVCINVQVEYNIDVVVNGHTIPCACVKSEVINLSTVSAFEVSVKLMNMKVSMFYKLFFYFNENLSVINMLIVLPGLVL